MVLTTRGGDERKEDQNEDHTQWSLIFDQQTKMGYSTKPKVMILFCQMPTKCCFHIINKEKKSAEIPIQMVVCFAPCDCNTSDIKVQ